MANHILFSYIRFLTVALLAMLPLGCGVHSFDVDNPTPITGTIEPQSLFPDVMTSVNEDTVIFLSFSGGGTRAAAFANGALRALAEHTIDVNGKRYPLVSKVKMISGVSGGSVPAAYFGLFGEEGIYDFRERFLIQDVEKSLRTSVFNPENIERLYYGGVNSPSLLADWLHENLFHNATMKDIIKPGKPAILINASDLYNRTPFIFTPFMFSSFCSDISQYPVAHAVAASSAFPLAFSPMILETPYPMDCEQQVPVWIQHAIEQGDMPYNIQSFFDSIHKYQKGDMPFVKLLDGGITDNLGLHGALISRMNPNTPYSPLTKETAIRIKRFVFFVIDAHRDETGDWNTTISGPKAKLLLKSVITTIMANNNYNAFDLLSTTLQNWKTSLVNYRCNMPRSQVKKIRGTLTGWDCHGVDVQLASVNFHSLPYEQKKVLNQIPTRFSLPENEVDLLIWAGYTSMSTNALFQKMKPTPIEYK